MKLFWSSLVIIVILLALYLTIHRIILNRATVILHRQNESVLDAAVKWSLNAILPGMPGGKSELVADVWGKGVMAYEYTLDMKEKAYDDDKLNRDVLNQALNDYAVQHNLHAADRSMPTMLVTDWWTYEGLLHIDVAYLNNEATVEYVKDLRKLEQN